jgi:hypothetical protein
MTNKDDDFDENGLLRNGRSARVGMMMRDSSDAERLTIVDAFGCGGAALHRPGPRYAVQGAGTTDPAPTHSDATHADVRDETYRQHNAEEARRWWQGTDREVPVKRVTGDARLDAYQDRDEHDANAWRRPTEER